MSFNAVLHAEKVRKIKRRVFYTGSDAVTKGYGLCYDRDVGTAASVDASRDKNVALPSATNNNAFAGVAARDYDAKTGGQWIDIYEPGGFAEIYVDAAVTIGETSFVWAQVGSAAGKFLVGKTGFMGKGAARVCQTSTGAGLILAELMTGEESGLIQVIPTATLTAGGAATLTVGGVTVFTGPATPASDVTATLADGTYIGQRKAYQLDGALTTNDVLITVTSGVQLDGSTALASLELDGDNDQSVLMFGGFGADTGTWRLIHNVGTGLA